MTRRDFMNGALVTTGAVLTMRGLAGCTEGPTDTAAGEPGWAGMTVPDNWYGYGGVGDYASSHGNTPTLIRDAHSLLTTYWDTEPSDVIDTEEAYDVVIVGAGMAGLGAALQMLDDHPTKRVLILDNHPVFGGQAKENEFLVDGVRLLGPQCANGFHVPEPYDSNEYQNEDLGAFVGDAYYFSRLNMPREFEYGGLTGSDKEIRFCQDNSQFTYNWFDWFDVAHQFHSGMTGAQKDAPKTIEINSWQNEFINAPLNSSVKAELLEVITTKKRPYGGEDFRKWLDTMSYQDYLERELGYSRAVTDYFSPIGFGMSCDAISAFAAYNAALPGFDGYTDFTTLLKDFERHSFPGGNSGIARHMLKEIIPDGIAGKKEFGDIVNGKINFEALDAPDNPIRMRLAATATRVLHEKNPAGQEGVSVVYAKDDRAQKVYAKAVVMAGGGWINKHVVRDLGQEWKDAYNSFQHAPFLVANVAVTNWRFLEKMGVSAIRYPYTKNSFGHACNIRAPMKVGCYEAPLDPNKPTVITFYAPLNDPAEGDVAAQVANARLRLFTTSFAEYEHQIREQMTDLFGDFGFDADADIAGIILNRWGHAYVVPEPGFYYGKDGKPPATEILSKPFGRIAFAHSEFKGNQHYGPAAGEGRRAVRQLAPFFV